jgi:tetratricopeptide (TPR) repeat protein
MEVFIIYISVIIIILLVHPITVFIHELGHAIPFVVFTKSAVHIFIGVDPNVNTSAGISLGRLKLHISANPTNWTNGYCAANGRLKNITQNIITTIGGPLLSLIFSFVLFIYILHPGVHGLIKVLVLGLLISSLFDFVSTFFGRSMKGPVTIDLLKKLGPSDADQLTNLFHSKKMAGQYRKAAKLINSGQNFKAELVFESMIKQNLISPFVLKYAAYLFAANAKPVKAIAALNLIIEQFPASEDIAYAYTNIGLLHINYLNDREKGKEIFQIASERLPDNAILLSNLDFVYLEANDIQTALEKFEKAITLDPDQAYNFAHRGLCKVKLSDTVDGFADLEHAQLLNADEPYIYRCYGILKTNAGEFKDAIGFFEKAKALEPSTYMIDELIAEAKAKTISQNQT